MILHEAGWSWGLGIAPPEHKLARFNTVFGEELECSIFARTVRQLESISHDSKVMRVRVSV